MRVFDFEDYKDFIRAQIKANPTIRGYRSALAETAGCQLSFLSQVLHSHVHLTPDHAAGLISFWGLDQNEQDYFLEIVNLARAGSISLKKLLKNRIQEIRERHENLAKRYQKEQTISPEDQAIYYSSWHFSAIHILLTIPGFQSINRISERLNLSPTMTFEALQQLSKLGLVEKNNSIWKPTQKNIHLSKNSILTTMNHSNWRSRAIIDATRKDSSSLHYTAVYSLGRSDFEKIKEIILKFLDETRSIVEPSIEEELCALNLDWFKV